MIEANKLSVVGTMEENISINFGGTGMTESTLVLAQNISDDYRSGNGMSISELSNKYERKRPQIKLFIYIIDTMPETLHWYFLNGYIGLKPLAELHKLHGNKLQSILDEIIEQKDTSKSKRITEKMVREYLTPSAAKADLKKQTPVRESHLEACINPNDGIASVHMIRAILNESCSINQDGSGRAMIDQNDFRKISAQLNLLEQFFDDTNTTPVQQGDPTDQSIGSFVHDNIIVHDEDIQIDIANLISYEDISQDPQDHNRTS